MHLPLTRSHKHSARRDWSLLNIGLCSIRLMRGLSHFFSLVHPSRLREKYTHLPSFRSFTRSTLLSVRRWADTNGWDIPRIPSNSQLHKSFLDNSERILKRLGSATIFIREKVFIFIFEIGQEEGRPSSWFKPLAADAARRTGGEHIDRPCHDRDDSNR